MKLLILLLLFSCTHLQEKKELMAQWQGEPKERLLNHPYFSRLKFKEVEGRDGSRLLTFSRGRAHITKASCQSLGGCLGTEDWCEHNFRIENDLIVDYQQMGPCPYDSAMRPSADNLL